MAIEDEKKQRYDEFLEKQRIERAALTINGVFTEEQAEVIQAYCNFYYYKR